MWILAITICLLLIWIRHVKIYPTFTGRADLTGKTVVVTGANSGIGKATALGLAKHNARVIMACRNTDKANAAVKEIREKSKNNNVHFMLLDLADFESIKSFVEDFQKSERCLHVLVNNAGIVDRGKTKQGFDNMFGTNHLGPFLLTNLLLPVMKKTAQHNPVRIVNVSADLYKISKIRLRDLNPDFGKNASFLSLWKQYAHTKLMNVYFTSHLYKKLSTFNDSSKYSITTYSLHPGVLRTGLGYSLTDSGFLRGVAAVFLYLFGTNSFYGSQTSLYCCLEQGIEPKSGGYFKKCKFEELAYAATDGDIGEKLWDKSCELCGLNGH